MPVTGLGGVGSSWDFPVAQRRQQTYLTPEEEQGLLRRIASTSLSGLAAAGNLLDLPGSMLRDIATWVPGGTPAQNPLDQLLTPFRPDNRISGRELLRGAGLIGKQDNWKNFLGGLATEIAMDPLLPFTFGGSALTRTGQALKGVGALDDALRIANVGKRLGRITLTPEQALSKLAPEAQTAARTALTEATKKMGIPAAQVAEEMTKPIGGLASYGIPFTNTRWVMGKGPASQAIARGMDVTGKAIAESAPGRAIAQQFDPNAMGLFGIMDQKIARAYSRLAPGSRAAALREYFDAVDAFEPTMQRFGQEYGNLLAPRGRAAGKTTRATPSSIIPGDVVFAADRSNYGWVHNVGKDNAVVRFRNPDTAAESIVKLPLSQLTLKHASGSTEAAQFADPFNRHVLGKLIRHAAETGGDVDEAFSLIAPKLAKVQQPSGSLKAMIQATGEILHDVNEPIHRSIIEKGGRRGSIEGISDFGYLPRGFKKRYEGESPTTPWESPRFLQVRPQSSKTRALPTAIVPEEIKRRILADPQAIAKSDKPLDMDKAAAYIESTYGKWLGKGDAYAGYINTATQAPIAPSQAHAHALADYVFKYPKRGAKAEQLPESVLMDNELRYFLGAHKTDRSLDAIHELFSQNMQRAGQGVPLRAAYSAAGLDPDRAMQYVAKWTGKPESLLENSTVSEGVANAAKMAMQFNENPEWAGAIGNMVRTATQWFKDHVTVIWPSFATRNLISGQTVNMLSGVVQTPRDIADYMAAFKDAAKMLKKPEKEFLRELEAWRVVGGQYGFEGASTFRAPTQGPLPESPFNIKQTHTENVTALAAQRAEREAATKEAIAAEQAVPSLLSSIGAKVPDRIKRTARATQALHRDVLATGAKVNQHVEWMNRVPLYLYMKRKGYTPEMAAKVVGDLQFDYAALSPFEKNIARVAFPFYCVPEYSEILTRDGWKKVDELKAGEDILTYNTLDKRLEWQPCLEVAIFDCDQPLLVWHNKRHRLAFTHNHRWPVRTKPCNGPIKKNGDPRKRYPEKYSIIEGRALNTNHQFIAAAILREEKSILSPTEARLLGWIITDGHFREKQIKGRSYYEAVIYQHPSKFLPEILRLTNSSARCPHPDSGVVAVNVPIEKLRPLIEILRSRDFIRVVTHLSYEAATAMYDAMYKADGTTKQPRTQDYFAGEKQEVREAFYLLAILLGKRVSASERGCYVSPCQTMDVSSGFMSEEHYTGRVWCPRSHNGTWVMRQGKTVVITGNTFTKKSAGLVGKTLLERPGGALAQTMRASTAGYTPDEFAPDYVRQTAAIRLPSGKSGDDRYITGFGFAHEDPLSFLSAGEGISGFIRGAGMEALSRMNPLLKGPAEFSVGQSFFQRGPSGGRPLEDLDPTVGRLLANLAGRKEPVPTGQLFEAIMANLPTTRALTTARTLTDPRKGPIAKAINTLTGMRINDVPVRTREALIRQVTENLMKDLGAFTFEKVYFPKEQLAQMPPEEQIKAKQLQWLTAALAQRAKERKQEALKNAGSAARP